VNTDFMGAVKNPQVSPYSWLWIYPKPFSYRYQMRTWGKTPPPRQKQLNPARNIDTIKIHCTSWSSWAWCHVWCTSQRPKTQHPLPSHSFGQLRVYVFVVGEANIRIMCGCLGINRSPLETVWRSFVWTHSSGTMRFFWHLLMDERSDKERTISWMVKWDSSW
jgi:hypothetical protein